MAGAYLRGTGIACALGLGTDACVSTLLEGTAGPGRVRLEALTEPLELAYFRIPDGAELFDVGRFKSFTGLTRKHAIPLLEHLDHARVTRNAGGTRVVL